MLELSPKKPTTNCLPSAGLLEEQAGRLEEHQQRRQRTLLLLVEVQQGLSQRLQTQLTEPPLVAMEPKMSQMVPMLTLHCLLLEPKRLKQTGQMEMLLAELAER